MKKTYSFDDILLVPKFSDVDSRSEIDISSELNEELKFNLPIISSPMDTITEDEMALAMADAGGLGIIHRYNTTQEQASIVSRALYRNENIKIAAAVGMTDFKERAQALISVGTQII